MEVSKRPRTDISKAILPFSSRPYTYKDSIPNCNSQEIANKVLTLKSELNKLENYENLLDRHKLWIEQSIKNLTNDIDSKKYLYATREDFIECSGTNDRFIAFNAPFDTNLQIQVSSNYIFVFNIDNR